MTQEPTIFRFEPSVSMRDVEDTLRLSRLATESLHGFGRVELDASCNINSEQRCVAIEANSEVGHTLALIFLGYIRREFGEKAFEIRRVVQGRQSITETTA